MRCAYCSFQPFLEFDARGTAIASAAMLDSVSSQAEVDLYYLTPSTNLSQLKSALQAKFPGVKEIYVFAFNPSGETLQRIRCGGMLLPLTVGALLDKSVKELISGIHGNPRYDVVHYDLMSWIYAHPCGVTTKPTVCSGHDAYSLQYIRKASHVRSLVTKLRYSVSALAFRRFEKNYLPRVDIVHLFSSNDADYLHKLGVAADMHVINMPLSEKWFANNRDHIAGNFHRYLMSGEHSDPWYANGLMTFVKDVWPLILERHPQSSITLHSGSITEETKALTAATDKVQLLGTVQDYASIFDENDLFVHPLLAGTGQKNRLAIAMAKGLCAVATDATVSGMHLKPLEDYVPLSLNKVEFSTLLQVLGRTDQLRDIARNGQDKIRTFFSPASVAKQFAELYTSIC